MDFLRKAGEWNVGEESLWLKLVKEVIRDRISQPISQMPIGVKSSMEDLKLACSYWRSGGYLQPQFAGGCLDSSELQCLAQAQGFQRDVDSSLNLDNQTRAIVPYEKFCLKDALDSSVASNALMVVQSNGEYLKNQREHSSDNLWKVPIRGTNLEDPPNGVVNGLSEVPSCGADFWCQTDYEDKDLTKLPDRGANSMSLKKCTRSFYNGEVVKDQAPYTFSVGRESYKNLANGLDL